MTSDRIVLIAAWLPSDPIFVKKHLRRPRSGRGEDRFRGRGEDRFRQFLAAATRGRRLLEDRGAVARARTRRRRGSPLGRAYASVEAQAIVTPMAASHVATSPNATLPEPRKSSIASTRPFVTHTVDLRAIHAWAAAPPRPRRSLSTAAAPRTPASMSLPRGASDPILAGVGRDSSSGRVVIG